VGDGANNPFWEARWLSGATPKDLARNLYASARFKKRIIQVELYKLNLIRNLAHIDS
jgi:hypothetical protein